MDHYQVLVPDVIAGASFYTGLGFRISDYLVVEGTDIVDRHLHVPQEQPVGPGAAQSLGAAIPSWVATWSKLDVRHDPRARLRRPVGFPECIEHGPGRHGHGHAYYTYVRDPDGHRTELLLNAIQITDRYDEPVACRDRGELGRQPLGLPAAEKLVR